ncbi:metallophosphoesterase family protein [Caballeronia sp.]|uniref:metallophosphoesterase family protein n=1 Tax=Caballeronia sp. TaxID=1931223 RepID=UPI003C344CC5
MTVLLHLSDLHFGTERQSVVDALLRLVDRVRPDLVVMSGDLTQRARRHQFDAARAFSAQFGATPFLTIPGNHDIPLFNVFGRATRPYAGFRRVFGDDLEPVFESAGLLAIGLNTTRAYRHKDGEVSPQQIERVARRLERATAQQLRVVVTHQPIAPWHAGELRDLLHGRERAVSRWLPAGVDLVLGGHLHRPYVVPLHAESAGLTARAWAVQAGTALSTRVRHGVANSVNVIRSRCSNEMDARARRVNVGRWDYLDEQKGFELVKQEELELGGHPASVSFSYSSPSSENRSQTT